MAKKHSSRGKWISRLQKHYRLVVMNDDNFEMKASLKLTMLNVLIVTSTLFVIFAAIIILLLKFTPASDLFFDFRTGQELKRDAVAMRTTIDSLEALVDKQTIYLEDIRMVMRGEVDTLRPGISAEGVLYDTLPLSAQSAADSLLRAEFDEKQQVGIFTGITGQAQRIMEGKVFVPPVRGIITKTFEEESGHFGIDIVGKEKEPIKAIYEGKVVFTGWTNDFGHVIVLQHADNLVSVYKHNSALLKKVGNFVRSGEVIALMGNTGELSQGPHLHFELWLDMAPVNPNQYIVFN